MIPGGRQSTGGWLVGDNYYTCFGFGKGSVSYNRNGNFYDLWKLSITNTAWEWIGGTDKLDYTFEKPPTQGKINKKYQKIQKKVVFKLIKIS